MDLPPVVAPGEFRHELLRLCGLRDAGQRRVAHLGERERAVADPGRESGHGPADVVSRPPVGDRVDRREGGERGGAAAAGLGAGEGRIGWRPGAVGESGGEARHEFVAGQPCEPPEIGVTGFVHGHP